jgi:23S rRNA pseudouridine2604 synthase
MSELDICSRREADRYIMEGRVMIGDNPVEPILGQKVPANESTIFLLSQPYKQLEKTHVDDIDKRKIQRRAWSDLQSTTVILHKPLGYVSGQPEEARKGGEQRKHTPAVRLLTPSNAHIVESNYDHPQEFLQAKEIASEELDFQMHYASKHTTLRDYVPAGRLDLNSSGLLIFTNSGVMAKKLISPEGLLEKEYIVLLEAVQSLTRHERQAGMTHLPLTPRDNTARMLKGGHTLWGEHRPLRPVVELEWLDLKQGLAQRFFPLASESPRNLRALRMVLKEGRKHQVRRMCRELLGMHVLDLVRTRIGPIELQSLPEGKWRPLRQAEAEFIYSSS